MKPSISVFIISLLLLGCFEINSDNPVQAYKYWSGANPPKDLEVIEGQYWQSPHWTLEYIMYLKIKPSKKWWKQFVKQNRLVEDKEDWIKPSDAPSWFHPSKNTSRLKQSNSFDQGSRYFRNAETGVCYIYEIQL